MSVVSAILCILNLSSKTDDVPCFEEFMDFLNSRAQAAEASSDQEASIDSCCQQKDGIQVQYATSTATSDKSDNNCVVCPSEHNPSVPSLGICRMKQSILF